MVPKILPHITYGFRISPYCHNKQYCIIGKTYANKFKKKTEFQSTDENTYNNNYPGVLENHVTKRLFCNIQ